VELFEQIRREYEHGVGTIKGVAPNFGVQRRMVRDAIVNAQTIWSSNFVPSIAVPVPSAAEAPVAVQHRR
jgi:hypothetical protein